MAQVAHNAETDAVNMSEIMQQFIEPFLESVATADDLRNLVALASIAWNVTLLPPERRQAALDEMLAALPPGLRTGAEAPVQVMMDRKFQHFAEFKRPVLRFNVQTLEDGNFYLQIAALPWDV